MNLHAVAVAAFGAFVLAVAAVVFTEWRGTAAALRAARIALALVVIGASLLSVSSQRNLWPFSNWALMTGAPRPDMGVDPTYLRLAVVDRAGAEHRVDYRAVEPFAFEELMAWMRAVFVARPPAVQDSAARYLLARINAARARVRNGRSPSTQSRWLGPFRAPYHLLHPQRWTTPASVPSGDFVALRVYSATWDLLERARDASAFTETVIYRYGERAP